MLRILAVVLVIVVVVVALIAAAALVAAVVKAVVRLAVAGCIAVLVGLLVHGLGQSSETAILVGALSFPLAAFLVWRWRLPSLSQPKAKTQGGRQILSPADDAAWRSPVRLDAEVEASWDVICSRLVAADIEALHHSREQCRLLLHFADEPVGQSDPDIAEHAMLIRRHVPALADEFTTAFLLVDEANRPPLIHRTSAALRSLGERSSNLLQVVRQRHEDALDVRSRHLANRLDGNDDLSASPDR